MHKTSRILALAAAALVAAPALAQNSVVKLGAIRYDAHSKTSGISGVGIPPGADAEVGDATTLLFTYEYRFTPKVGVEFVLGVPPKITAKATGTVAFLGEVLSARNVSPAMIVNYHFGDTGDALRPYLGLGLNYTKFTSVKTPYGWDVKLSDATGFVAQAGVNYALNKDWGLFASIARVDTKARLVATGATVLQTRIDFAPRTYEAGVSYRF